MNDRTGQVWELGGTAIYLVIASPSVSDDPNWTLSMTGSLEHRAFELEAGYVLMLLELNEDDWEHDGFHRRIL